MLLHYWLVLGDYGDERRLELHRDQSDRADLQILIDFDRPPWLSKLQHLETQIGANSQLAEILVELHAQDYFSTSRVSGI